MSYEQRQLQWELVEKQKNIWRIEIANSLNKLGIPTWRTLPAMDNSIAVCRLLMEVGFSPATANRIAWESKAEKFWELPSDPEAARKTYDDFRYTAHLNMEHIKLQQRIEFVNELITKGMTVWLANATALNPIATAKYLNYTGWKTEDALEYALSIQSVRFEPTPKDTFGKERSGVGKFFSNIGRVFEIHHWKIIQELARPLTKSPTKKINQEFQNAIQDVHNHRLKYLSEVDIAAANQRNLLQWQYGKTLSDDQAYQMQYNETYSALDEVRIQLIVVNLNDANNVSLVLGNMVYEKQQHDIVVANWKHAFVLAESDIQLNVQKKKNLINHECDKNIYQLNQQREDVLDKTRRKGAKQLIIIAGSAFIAPQIGQYLAAQVGTTLSITGTTAKAVLTGALTGMAFSGVHSILSGDTKHLTKNVFKGTVLGGIGGYANSLSQTMKVLETSENLRTIFVATVKATAASLINHEKLGQGLVTSICEGLLLDNIPSGGYTLSNGQKIPSGFLIILRDAMLRAGASIFVDTLLNGGPLGDKLAIAGMSAFFQSLGEYGDAKLKFWIDTRAKQKKYEQELDKPESTPMKALEQANDKEDPKDLIALRDSIIQKGNNESAKGNQIAADNYLNAANNVDAKLYRKTHFDSSASFVERWNDITEFFKNKDATLLNDVIETGNAAINKDNGSVFDRRDQLNEQTQEFRNNLERDRGAGLVDVLTFGLSKKVTQTVADTTSLGYKQGQVVGDALQGELAGAALLHYGAKALNLTIKHTKEFVQAHDFRSPVVFKYKQEVNQIRLNSGIPIDSIKIKKQIPWKLTANKNNLSISNNLNPATSFTPAFNEIKSFYVKSALDGELYPKNKLIMLVNYLEKRGTYVYGTTGAPRFQGKNNAASQIYLPENPTILQVKHELSHWLDFKKLGYKEYSKLSVYQRENMVLERLQKNRIWKDLNQFEKDFSLNYVEKIRLGHRPGEQI